MMTSNYRRVVADRGSIRPILEDQLRNHGFAIWAVVQMQADVTRQGMGWFFKAHADEYAYYYVRKYTADGYWIDRIIHRAHENPYLIGVKVAETLGVLTRKPRSYTTG
jgi:hypothetical protein